MPEEAKKERADIEAARRLAMNQIDEERQKLLFPNMKVVGKR